MTRDVGENVVFFAFHTFSVEDQGQIEQLLHMHL